MLPGVGSHRYAYAGQDPVNARDPGGSQSNCLDYCLGHSISDFFSSLFAGPGGSQQDAQVNATVVGTKLAQDSLNAAEYASAPIPIVGGAFAIANGADVTTTIGLELLGPFGDGLRYGGKLLRGIGTTAPDVMAEVRRLGREGELAAGITGPKSGIMIPGTNTMRYPDELTERVLREVKNVDRKSVV